MSSKMAVKVDLAKTLIGLVGGIPQTVCAFMTPQITHVGLVL